MEIVYVEWLDAASESIVDGEEALAKLVPIKVVSVGILSEDHPDYIRLYENRFALTPDIQYREALVIVRGMITKVQKFTVK